MLVPGPTYTARERVAKGVLAEKNQGSGALVSRGVFYDQLFLRTGKVLFPHNLRGQTETLLVRKAKGGTPQVSHHSRPSHKVTR